MTASSLLAGSLLPCASSTGEFLPYSSYVTSARPLASYGLHLAQFHARILAGSSYIHDSSKALATLHCSQWWLGSNDCKHWARPSLGCPGGGHSIRGLIRGWGLIETDQLCRLAAPFSQALRGKSRPPPSQPTSQSRLRKGQQFCHHWSRRCP